MNKRMDFSLDNFKKFLREQKKMKQEDTVQEDQDDNIIGCEVESKISYKKLISKIEIDEGCEEEVCKDFLDEGGTIQEVEGVNFLIEVTSGSFYINRSHIRRR